MKLLIENWRSFVNEEEDQKEGGTSVSQEDIDALFDDHASGRPFDAETEKVLDSGATINEVEDTEEGYDKVLQDFIAIHNNIDNEIANENSALSQLEKIASKEAFTKYVDKAAANLKRDVTCLNLINRSKTVIDYKIEDFSTPENLYDFKLINLAKGFAEKHKDEITVFPGSYNPLHDAHKQMVEMVLKQYPDQFIVHEICLGNIDKPTIDCEDISKRFAQFDQGKLILTDHTCARFIFKYDFFHQNYKKVNFVMGYDTYERLLDDPEIKVLAALMKMRGEKIFVFGKIKEIRKPHCGEEVFEFFEFESDIRSSKIRMEKEL